MRPDAEHFEGLLDGRLRRFVSRLHNWNLDFVEQTQQGSDYRRPATKVEESLRFMRAIGVDTTTPEFTQSNFYTAHECLLLPYEQAMTRGRTRRRGGGTTVLRICCGSVKERGSRGWRISSS